MDDDRVWAERLNVNFRPGLLRLRVAIIAINVHQCARFKYNDPSFSDTKLACNIFWTSTCLVLY